MWLLYVRDTVHGIDVNEGTDVITVTNTSPVSSLRVTTPTTALSNTASLVSAGVGSNIVLRRLVGKTGIVITESANDTVELTNSTSLASTVVSGAVDLVKIGLGPALVLRNILGTAGITAVQSSDSITLSSAITITSEAGQQSIVSNGVAAPAFKLKAINAGAGITLASNDTSLTVTNSSPATSVQLESVGSGAGWIQTTSSVAPVWKLRSILASGGLQVVEASDTITITNTTASGNSVTLTNLGSGVGLVSGTQGPDMTMRSLVAGTGISLTLGTPNNTVVVTNTSPLSALTVSDAPGTAARLVHGSTSGGSVVLRRITGAAGVTVTEGTDAITVSAALTTLANASGAGVGLTANGQGPALTLRTLVAGTGIALVADAVANTVTMSANLASVTQESGGTVSLLTSASTSQNVVLRSISAGSGIQLSNPTGTSLSISSTAALSDAITGVGVEPRERLWNGSRVDDCRRVRSRYARSWEGGRQA